MANHFYEFTEPVYALIKAPEIITAIRVYREDVLGEIDAPDKLVWQSLGYTKTLNKFQRASGMKHRDIYDILKSQPPEVLLQDVAYM